MSTSADVGKKIRTARLTAEMTQKDAAEAIGVSRKTIINWECGDALSMSLGNAIEMAEVYGCKTVDQLVGRASLTESAP